MLKHYNNVPKISNDDDQKEGECLLQLKKKQQANDQNQNKSKSDTGISLPSAAWLRIKTDELKNIFER